MKIYAVNNDTGHFFFDFKFKADPSAFTLTDYGLTDKPEDFLEFNGILFKAHSSKNPDGDLYSLKLEIL